MKGDDDDDEDDDNVKNILKTELKISSLLSKIELDVGVHVAIEKEHGRDRCVAGDG